MLALALLSLLSVALAQSSSNESVSTASQVAIEGIEANFQDAELVPQLLPTFTPNGLIDLVFDNHEVTIGQNLSETDVATYPGVSFTPATNATSLYTASSMFTLMMVDANPVGTDETETPQTRHWLVNNVSLEVGSTGGWAVNYNGSIAITNYNGPGPAAGSGSHRYCVLLYSQPDTFTPPANLSTANTPLGTFFLESYVQESGLQGPVAGNYFQVEVGIATITVPNTTPVDSSTLPGFGSMTSSTPSMTPSASSPSSTSSTSAKSGAGTKQEIGLGAIVGALGVAGAVIGAGLGF